MQAIEWIRKVMLEYYCASGIQEEQEALTCMKFIAGPVLFIEVLAHIGKLEEENERLHKDAERYAALRRGQKWSVVDAIGNTLRAEELDAAIDAATKGTL